MGMIQYTVAKSLKDIDESAKLALEHHLYVEGWRFYNWLRGSHRIKCIVLCFVDQVPIGIGITYDESSPDTGVYVDSNYRKQGIGTEILRLLSAQKNRISCSEGVVGSKDFFIKCRKRGILFTAPYLKEAEFDLDEEPEWVEEFV